MGIEETINVIVNWYKNYETKDIEILQLIKLVSTKIK